MTALDGFEETMKSHRVEISGNIEPELELARQLINFLEIGSLNLIGELANSIKADYDCFMDKYPTIKGKLLEFRGLVEADFNQLFTFPDKLHALKI